MVIIRPTVRFATYQQILISPVKFSIDISCTKISFLHRLHLFEISFSLSETGPYFGDLNEYHWHKTYPVNYLSVPMVITDRLKRSYMLRQVRKG